MIKVLIYLRYLSFYKIYKLLLIIYIRFYKIAKFFIFTLKIIKNIIIKKFTIKIIERNKTNYQKNVINIKKLRKDNIKFFNTNSLVNFCLIKTNIYYYLNF